MKTQLFESTPLPNGGGYSNRGGYNESRNGSGQALLNRQPDTHIEEGLVVEEHTNSGKAQDAECNQDGANQALLNTQSDTHAEQRDEDPDSCRYVNEKFEMRWDFWPIREHLANISSHVLGHKKRNQAEICYDKYWFILEFVLIMCRRGRACRLKYRR